MREIQSTSAEKPQQADSGPAGKVSYNGPRPGAQILDDINALSARIDQAGEVLASIDGDSAAAGTSTPGFRTATAQRNDSISTLVGTSNPGAIQRFKDLNGIGGSSSRIFAGREYKIPTDLSNFSQAETAGGQETLVADNAAIAQSLARQAAASAQAATGSNTGMGGVPFYLDSNSAGPALPVTALYDYGRGINVPVSQTLLDSIPAPGYNYGNGYEYPSIRAADSVGPETSFFRTNLAGRFIASAIGDPFGVLISPLRSDGEVVNPINGYFLDSLEVQNAKLGLITGAFSQLTAALRPAATALNVGESAFGGFGPSRLGLETPQGFTPRTFDVLSSKVRATVDGRDLGDDIFLQGSRSAGTARPNSDFDFGIRVSSNRFEELISQNFRNVSPGSSASATRDFSIRFGRIQTGEAGLRDVNRVIARTLNVPQSKVQISVIRAGGPFDSGPQTPLSFKF